MKVGSLQRIQNPTTGDPIKRYSFIDFGKKDFLRHENGDVVIIKGYHYEHAQCWLLDNGKEVGWTNTGTRYWCWDDEGIK